MAREKRSAARIKKRLLVHYGEHGLDRSGFTADVSTTGMFVVSSTLPALDTRLHLQVFFGEGDFTFFEGRVRRHRLVPVELRSIEKAGFGVEFLAPAALLADRLRRRETGPVESVPRFRLDIRSAPALRELWERELKHGGIFITSERTPGRDEIAEVELALRFAPGEPSLRFPARVLQILQVPGAPAGIGFEFLDRRGIAEKLQPMLGVR
jgi:hypothetical protein